MSIFKKDELQFPTPSAQLRLASPHRPQRRSTLPSIQETLEQEEAMIE
jgi:hypothetical protein